MDLILNSIYFKADDSFNKQKGTPSGQAISPILADMVMKDLEVFPRFYFYNTLEKIHTINFNF